MESVVKYRLRIRSAEEAAFAKEYNNLLRDVSHPVKLAKVLFTEGIISSETKTSITSDADEKQKRKLLDDLQNSLSQAKDTAQVMKKLMNALEEIGVDTGRLQRFIDSKQN